MTSLSQLRVILAGYFLIFFLFTGLILTITIPPFQVPDEHGHWGTEITRLSQITHATDEKNYWNALPFYFKAYDGADLQKRWESPAMFLNIASMEKRQRYPVDMGYGTVLTYPGFLMARLLTQPVKDTPVMALIGFYLARLLGGLLIFFALMRTTSLLSKNFQAQRTGMLTVLALCFSPLFVQQSFGVDSDVVCNCFCLWLILLWDNWKELRIFDLFVLLLLGVVACSTKPMFAIIAASLFIFSFVYYQGGPSFKKGSPLESTGGYAAVIGIGGCFFFFLLAGQWGFHYAVGRYATFIQALPPGANVLKQIAWIMDHPAKAYLIVNHGFFSLIGSPQWAVSPLGWLNLELSASTILVWRALLLLAVMLDVLYGFSSIRQQHLSRPSFSLRLAGALILLIGGYVFGFLFCLGGFMHWSAVGGSTVQGVQSRHLFGAFFLAILALYFPFYENSPPPKLDFSIWKCGRGGKIFAVVLGLCFLDYTFFLTVDVLNRYWTFMN